MRWNGYYVQTNMYNTCEYIHMNMQRCGFLIEALASKAILEIEARGATRPTLIRRPPFYPKKQMAILEVVPTCIVFRMFHVVF